MIAQAPGRGKFLGDAHRGEKAAVRRNTAAGRWKAIGEDVALLEAEAAPRKQRPNRLRLKIGEDWFDCTGWARKHPGGARFIQFFDGKDATNAFYALHSFGANGSSKATNILHKLPRCDPPTDDGWKGVDPCVPFDEFRKSLAEEGWFDRVWWREALALLNVVALCATGTIIAHASHALGPRVLATFLIGVGMQQAGWLGHDYIHGRGRWCEAMRCLGGIINGHSTDWWTQKHSMHHTFTNDESKDEDIVIEPIFFLRSPEETGRADSVFRRFQHWYGYAMYALTFAHWRFDSIRSVVRRKDYGEALVILQNYAWLLMLPPAVAVGSVLVSGFLVGAIVTATHQSEEIVSEQTVDFVEAQFYSTRDAQSENRLVEYIWGGMDYQLEHHLFPSMPRYKYRALRCAVRTTHTPTARNPLPTRRDPHLSLPFESNHCRRALLWCCRFRWRAQAIVAKVGKGAWIRLQDFAFVPHYQGQLADAQDCRDGHELSLLTNSKSIRSIWNINIFTSTSKCVYNNSFCMCKNEERRCDLDRAMRSD